LTRTLYFFYKDYSNYLINIQGGVYRCSGGIKGSGCRLYTTPTNISQSPFKNQYKIKK